MCLVGIIQPSSSSTTPLGPIIVIGLLSFKSPESLTGGLSPNLYESVLLIST